MEQQKNNEVPEGPEQPHEEPQNEPEGEEPHAVQQPELMIVGTIPVGTGNRRDQVVSFEADGSFEPIHQPRQPQRHRPGVIGLPSVPIPGPSSVFEGQPSHPVQGQGPQQQQEQGGDNDDPEIVEDSESSESSDEEDEEDEEEEEDKEDKEDEEEEEEPAPND